MKEDKPYTHIKTASETKGEKTDWKNVAEVRMLMYVIPVGIAIALLSLLLSNL